MEITRSSVSVERIEALEELYVPAEYFVYFDTPSGSTYELGTAASVVGTTAEYVLNGWAEGIDVLVCAADSYGRPNPAAPVTDSGATEIYCALDQFTASGANEGRAVLSGTPATAFCVIFAYRIQQQYFDDSLALFGSVTEGGGGGAVSFGGEPGTVSSSTSGAAGSNATASRSDHSHDLGTHAHTGATDGGTIALASTTASGLTTGHFLKATGAAAFGWAAHGITANDLLPSQTGNNGKFLTTDGTDTSWATVSGGGVDVDDTPVDGATTDAISSNWAYDHAAAANPHSTSYSDVGAAAASHAHGNVTSAGAIGSTSGLPIKTGASGALEAGAFGTGAGEFCAGNDARLSDARTPASHDNTYHSATYITSAGVTYEALNGNSDVGTGASQVAAGNHNHTGTYEPVDATILRQSDVDDTPVDGVTTAPVSSNWAYDHANASNPHSITADGILPTQTGNSGKFLTTNGSASSWGAPGDVLGPATNTDAYVPQWNGANSKTLKNGLAFLDEDAMGSNSDAAVASQQSIKAYADTKLALAGGTLSGALVMADQLLTRPKLKDFSYEEQSVSSSSGALTIDLESGNIVSTTLTENVTSSSVTHWPASGDYGAFLLILTQAAAAKSVTWTFVDVWHTSDGNAPDVSTASAVYLLCFFSTDAGTTVHGMCSKQ